MADEVVTTESEQDEGAITTPDVEESHDEDSSTTPVVDENESESENDTQDQDSDDTQDQDSALARALHRVKAERNDAREELSKLRDSYKAVSDELATLKVSSLRHEVVTAQGLPPEAVDFIQGSNAEDITASGEALKKLLETKQQSQPFGVTRREASSPAQGLGDYLRGQL